MMDDLEKHGWPISKDDIEALENEIKEGNTYLQQSQNLRKASDQVCSSSTVIFNFNFTIP